MKAVKETYVSYLKKREESKMFKAEKSSKGTIETLLKGIKVST